MAYCDIDDVKKSLPVNRLIELTNDVGESYNGDITNDMAAIVTNCIANADAIIDDYCRNKYDIPFATVPTTIKKLSVDISIYFLYSRIKPLSPDDMQRIVYEDSLTYLRRISSGDVVLDVTPEVETDVLIPVKTNKVSGDRYFPSSELAKF